MKHKVGDTVTIRKDLKIYTLYDRCLMCLDMMQYTGYTTEIAEVHNGFYTLNIDEEFNDWTDEMLESV